MSETQDRLDYLRGEIEAERISMMELLELQGYGEAGLIPDNDILLLQWAGVPEFPRELVAEVTLTVGFTFDEELDEDAIKEHALEWIGQASDAVLSEGMEVSVKHESS